MIQDDLNKFPHTAWVKIYHNKMQLMQHDGTVMFTQIAHLSYAHPRSIIHQTDHAISNLSDLLAKDQQQQQAPQLFLQLLEHTEFGLTDLETDAIKHVAKQASNANIVRLYNEMGECIEQEDFHTEFGSPKSYRSFVYIGLITLILCIFLTYLVLNQSNI